MKLTRATVEYRASTAASRPFSRVGFTSTMVIRPPSQIPAKSTCRKIAVMAESWFSVPPVWPSSDIGTRPTTATTVTNSNTVTLRTAKHSTVTVAAIRVVASHACPSPVPVRKPASTSPNALSRRIVGCSTVRNVKKALAAAATAQRADEPAATSSALENSGFPESRANNASTRAPMVPATPMLTRSFEIGSP